MRVAPCGMVGVDQAFELWVIAAALTHSHPSGYLDAGAFALQIAFVLDGASLDLATRDALERVRQEDAAEEVVDSLEAALVLAAVQPEANPDGVESLGGGWVAEEAMAMATYCALTAPDLRRGVLAAVNHSGDSDSTGAIAGNLLGAPDGIDAVPETWRERLAEIDIVERMADDVSELVQG